MGWEQQGPGGLPPFGRHGDFGEAGNAGGGSGDHASDPDPLADQETHILRPIDRIGPFIPADPFDPDASAPSVPMDDWITKPIPPELAARPLPKKMPKDLGAPKRIPRPLVIALSAVLVLAVVAGGVALAVHGSQPGTPGKPGGPSCGANTPCKVAQNYLAAYTGGNYEQMYAQTSAASRAKFNDPATRGGYTDAHDYIVNRTSALITEARVYSIGATQEAVKQTTATTASVPVHIEMKSSQVGTITQDITLPLVQEKGTWRVDWSPGLIFSQLDDPADAHYARKLHLFPADGARGTIYDRDGNILAQDTTVYQIGVEPGKIKNEAAMLAALSPALGIPQQDIKNDYAGASPTDFVLIRTVPPQLFNAIQNTINAQGSNGVLIQTTTSRVYPYGADLMAVTGYVSVVTADDLKNDAQHYYQQGDLVGHAGLEQWGEQYLRPIPGGNLDIVSINADGTYGQVAYRVAHRDSVNGDDVHTTISLASQQATMASMRAHATGQGLGAFAVDPATGEVLVMASNPACDPNDFSLDFQAGISACVNDTTHKPLLNYAISAGLPTGSIFKIVTMAAALSNGYTSTQQISCTGTYQVPGESETRFDWVPTGRGSMTLEQALAVSCDTVFWQVAVGLNAKDPTILPTMARAFGFGSATNIVGVPSGVENSGLVPDPDWLQKTQNQQWSASAAADLGIGQGYFEANAAQVAMVGAALGNNGVRMQPRLVTSVTDTTGKAVAQFPPTQAGKLPITADAIHDIEVGMLSSTQTSGGTSNNLFKSVPVPVAGKTGSAESGQPLPHAWFVCFAPATPLNGPATPVQSTIAVGVVNAFSGHGADEAAPVTVAMLQAFFKGQ